MSPSALQKTSLWLALSPLGRAMETPKGIFYWSKLSREKAEIDGTIGIAQDDDATISHLKIAEQYVGEKIMARSPKGKVFSYAPIEGVESLRKKWLAKILKEHPTLERFTTLPVVTNGITHSLALAGRLLLEAGQTLITADKSWENYEHIFTTAQSVKIATFPLFNANGKLYLDALIESCREVAAQQGKVILLLNFPHNQTGYMPSHNECLALGKRLHELCKQMPKIPFIILIDDAYEGYVYDDEGQKKSLLSELFAPFPNLTLVKLDGISKSLLAYGYRIGFITFFINSLDAAQFSPEFLSAVRSEVGSKIGGFIRAEISQVNHHGQLLAEALMDDLQLVERQRAQVIEQLRQRWKVMMEAFDKSYAKYGKSKIWIDPCNSGFFCYANLAKGLEGREIAQRLIEEKRVGVVPSKGAAYKGLRIAFAGVPKDKIARMIEAIFEIIYR